MAIDIKRLESLGINLEELKNEYHVLCLPENIKVADKSKELVEAGDSIDLYKQLRLAGANCGNSLDIGLQPKILVRNSFEFWYGVVVVFNLTVLPILINVISQLIVRSISNKSDKQNAVKSDSNQIIHIDLLVSHENSFKEINFDGDPKSFLKILREIEKGDK